jgi:hypothetical protein
MRKGYPTVRWDPSDGLRRLLAKAIYPGLSWVIEIGMTQNTRSWKSAESAKIIKTMWRSGDEAAALSLRRTALFIAIPAPGYEPVSKEDSSLVRKRPQAESPY